MDTVLVKLAIGVRVESLITGEIGHVTSFDGETVAIEWGIGDDREAPRPMSRELFFDLVRPAEGLCFVSRTGTTIRGDAWAT